MENKEIENEFSKIKEKFQEVCRHGERGNQSLEGLNSIKSELDIKCEIIQFKYTILEEYRNKCQSQIEEKEKNGIFEKPTRNWKTPIFIIEEIENEINDAKKEIDTFEKQVMLFELDVNSFPSDTANLKYKINVFMAKNPNYSGDCQKMIKKITEMENKHEIYVKLLNVDQKIIVAYRKMLEKSIEAFGHLKNLFYYDNRLQVDYYNINHPDEAPKE